MVAAFGVETAGEFTRSYVTFVTVDKRDGGTGSYLFVDVLGGGEANSFGAREDGCIDDVTSSSPISAWRLLFIVVITNKEEGRTPEWR